MVSRIFGIIADLRREGIAILLSEQNARMSLKIADYAYVMETGKIVVEGKGSDLLARSDIAERYLGVGEEGAKHDDRVSSLLNVTVASEAYDRVEAIRDGRVGIEGCSVNYLTVGPEELFFRAYRNAEFDICELSMSSYLMSLARGDNAYVAIPVFLSRQFRHNAIYIRTDRGIESPRDLIGRRVGVPEYQVTAALWVRAFLEEPFGVPPTAFSWFHGGLHEPGRIEKVALSLPPSISYQAIGKDETLDGMLACGDLDALISPRPPRCWPAPPASRPPAPPRPPPPPPPPRPTPAPKTDGPSGGSLN
eukprot:gene29484-33136_t